MDKESQMSEVRFSLGNFICDWEIHDHGLAVVLRLGRGLGHIPLASALLPGARSENAEQMARSWCLSLIRALQQDCTRALAPVSTGLPLPTPAPAAPIRFDTTPAPVPTSDPTPVLSALLNFEKPVSRAFFTEAPKAHAVPLRFGVGSLVWEVNLWRDIMTEVGRYLAGACPATFESALTADEFRGRTRRSVSATADGMRQPTEIRTGVASSPTGFIETAYGSTDLLAAASKLIRYCGEDPTKFWYEVCSEPTPTA